MSYRFFFFFFQAEDGIRDRNVTGVQTCALPISVRGVQADRHERRVSDARAGAEEDPREHAARLPSCRYRAVGRKEGAFQRDPEGTLRALEQVLRQRARRERGLGSADQRRDRSRRHSRERPRHGAQSAREKGKEGWRFTLEAPSYIALMTYADKRALRRAMYEAYV